MATGVGIAFTAIKAETKVETAASAFAGEITTIQALIQGEVINFYFTGVGITISLIIAYIVIRIAIEIYRELKKKATVDKIMSEL